MKTLQEVVSFLKFVFVVGILLIGIGVYIEVAEKKEIDRKFDDIETKLIVLNLKLDSIKTESQSVFIEITNKEQLYKYLVHKKIEYPEVWVAISILESGWNWNSEFASIHHNIFGFNNCYFKNKKECVDYLEQWIALNPPLKNESYESFLKRRNYNPYINIYYPNLASVLDSIVVNLPKH